MARLQISAAQHPMLCSALTCSCLSAGHEDVPRLRQGEGRSVPLNPEILDS
jgi:hypothetical protein